MRTLSTVPQDTVTHAVDSVRGFVSQVQALPWGVHGVAAAAMIAGLILWLKGRVVLKPMLVLLAATLGAAGGYFVFPVSPLKDTVSPHTGLGIGLVLGAVLGLALYRFAMAVSLGVVSAVAASLVALAFTVPEGESVSPIDLDQGREMVNRASDAGVAVGQDATASDRVRAFIETISAELRSSWEAIPTGRRLILAGAAAGGLLLGLAGGLLLPAWGASAVTAMFGSAIWIPNLLWLARATGIPIPAALEFGPRGWLTVWAAVSLAGMAMQWRGLLKRRKKPEPEPDSDPKKA
ncbi:MAG: hypothetical protein JNM07_09095 [Phycisphaerae bacterium]|nr:hypothetical protein [Phycisphaerae bacterium]